MSSDSSDSESGDNTADDGEDGVHHAMVSQSEPHGAQR